MAPSGPDASNSCLPPLSPVVVSIPPIPSTTRGERCALDGDTGRLNAGRYVLVYPSGKLVVARRLADLATPLLPSMSLPVLVYRGHHANVTAVKMAPSGCYVASGDERGMLRVWAYDHDEHLCKYDNHGLTGPLRDLDWDGESKKVALVGDRADARSECARVVQWDTGVTTGQLAAHLKGRVAAVAFKPNRPFRLVTAGKDDARCYFHKGPPFAKIPAEADVPTESAHVKGAVHAVRYSHAGAWVASTGTDKSLCIYDGTTFALQHQLANIHQATVYDCAWSGDDRFLLTASGDGTCKLFAIEAASGAPTEIHTWHPAQHQLGHAFDKVPVGGNQLGCTFVNGSIPVSVSLNGQLSILPMPEAESQDMTVITGHNAVVAGLAIDHATQTMYTGDTDGILCAWSTTADGAAKGRLLPPEGNPDLAYVTHSGAISGLACLPSNGLLLSVGWDDKMYVTARGSLQVRLNPVSLPAQPTTVVAGTNRALIVTVQGLLLVNAGGTLATGDLIKLPYTALCACMSLDDQTVYVGGDDKKVHVYVVTDGGTDLNETGILEAHLQPVYAVALSHDQTKLASADSKDICVFDVTTAPATVLVNRGRWCFHVQRITSLSWSFDDAIVASGSSDNSIYLWSPTHVAKRVHYPYAHRGGIAGLQFLPMTDGSYQFWSVGADSVLNKWDVTKDAKAKFA